jgi:hypothetical protein
MADGPRWVGWASFDGQKMQKPKQPKMLCFFSKLRVILNFYLKRIPFKNTRDQTFNPVSKAKKVSYK